MPPRRRRNLQGTHARLQETRHRHQHRRKVEKIEKTESGVKVTWTDANGKPVEKEAEKVLVAVGRAGAHCRRRHRQNQNRARPRLRQGRRSAGDRRARHLRHRRHRRRPAAARALRLYERHRRCHQNRRPQVSFRPPRSRSCLHLLRSPDRLGWTDRSAGQRKGPTRSRSANFHSREIPRPPSSAATTASSRSSPTPSMAKSSASTSSVPRPRN